MAQKPEKTFEDLNGGQQAQLQAYMRDNFIYFQVRVGTPWDGDEYIAFSGQISREEFVLGGRGILAQEFAAAGKQIEDHIRNVLMTAKHQSEEADRFIGPPLDAV